MVHPSIAVQRSPKECNIVFVFGDIALEELYTFGVVFPGELLSRGCVQITEDEQSPTSSKDSDRSCTDAIRAAFVKSADATSNFALIANL